jgi:hypothetical protein
LAQQLVADENETSSVEKAQASRMAKIKSSLSLFFSSLHFFLSLFQQYRNRHNSISVDTVMI